MSEQTSSKAPQIRFKGHSETWRTKSVSSLLTERNVQAPKSEQYPLMAFIAGQGVASKGKRYNREFLVSDELNKKYKQTELGDFIYSSNNLETGSIGTNNYGSASISPVYSIFSPTIEGDSSFIGQLLCKKAFINEMVKWRQGVVYGQWRIHESVFLKIEATFPNVDEQTQIGEYFRELDSLIGLHQRKHDKLVTLKKAMLQKMFPQVGATIPEIRFKGFSGNWKKEKIETISDSYSGGTPSVGSRTYYGGKIPFIRSAEINAISTELTITELGFRDSAAKMVSEGDILYALYGATSGEVGISQMNGAINQAVLAIKPHSGYSPQFIATWLRNRKVEIIGTYLQGGQGNLSGAIVKSLHVDLPCLQEQQKIGTYFRTLDELIAQHATQLQKLQQIKSACLEKMFV